MEPYKLMAAVAWGLLLLLYGAVSLAALVRLWGGGLDEEEDVAAAETERAVRAFAEDPQRLARACGLRCPSCGDHFVAIGASIWCSTCDPTPHEALVRLGLERRAG